MHRGDLASGRVKVIDRRKRTSSRRRIMLRRGERFRPAFHADSCITPFFPLNRIEPLTIKVATFD
jgi:hypothetical protein